MNTWKETNASSIWWNSQENATSFWDKNTTQVGTVCAQVNQNLWDLEQQNAFKSKLFHLPLSAVTLHCSLSAVTLPSNMVYNSAKYNMLFVLLYNIAI